MKNWGKIGIIAVAAALLLPAAVLYGAEQKDAPGAKLFAQHCSACHPNGGNIINPAYTLHAKALKAHGVKSVKDIVGKMRKPGPGMTRFDAKTLPDKEAREIAEYILTTFK